MWKLIRDRPVQDQGCQRRNHCAHNKLQSPTEPEISRLCGVVHVVKRKTGVVRTNSSCMRHTSGRKYSALISRLCGVPGRSGPGSGKRPIRACGIENPSACDTPRGGTKPHGFRGCQGGVPEIVEGFGDVGSRNHTKPCSYPALSNKVPLKKNEWGQSGFPAGLPLC